MKRKISVIALTGVLTLSMCSSAFAGRTLENGMSGDDVYELQSALYNCGYFDYELTGYFGDITEAAVKDFQYDYDLEVDGLAGPITCSYLGVTTSDDNSSDDDDDDAGSYSSEFTRVLYYDMSGDDVYSLQILLRDAGYFQSTATGYYGDLTKAAVEDFQYDYNLDVDGVAGPVTLGMLTGEPVSPSDDNGSKVIDYVSAVLESVESTPATANGYCAEWVTWVMERAGILTYSLRSLRSSYLSYAATSGLAEDWYSDDTGFNANDYWAYVCYSSNVNDLQPGMIVATRSSYTYLGKQFGHVGIYIGDGKVVSSIGYKETLTLEEFDRRYNNTELGSTIAWGYLPVG